MFAFWSWVPGALAGCRCKVLLSECCVHFGAGLLVQLQGCRCRVPLQGAAVRVLFALWSLVAGALQGAAAEAVQGAGLLFIFPPHFQAQKGLGGLVCL